jgi:pimeloyl-ACP methyl ester carboxylesterase
MRLALTIIALVLVLLLVGAYWLWTPDRSRAGLEAKYLGKPADILEIAGTRLHVRDSGPRDAPAVIMLHGFGSSLHTWETWARSLGDAFRVIRFDLPGSGLSPPDFTGDYTDARSLQLLAALMDRLGAARASLIGNSIGGRIAWRFAAETPARVDKLVLVSPDGFASPGFEYGRQPKVPRAAQLMRYTLPRALVRMNLVPAFGDKAALTDDLVTRYYDLMLAPGARDAMISRMQQTILRDPVPLLQRIQAPTLLLWGERDGLIPITNAADYLKAMPNARLVRLPGIGHVPQEEAPQASLAPVRAFLSEP